MDVIGRQINGMGCSNIIVNGTADHVHLFFSTQSSHSVSEVIKKVQLKSAFWLDRQDVYPHSFAWQTGFLVFSHGPSEIEQVSHYIENQEEFHKTKLLREEVAELLEYHNLKCNERYVFDPLV